MSKESTVKTELSETKKHYIDVYCPTGAVITKEYADTASRVRTLEGRKIGLLWNGKPNGDIFLDRIAEILEKKYKDIEIIKFWKVDPEHTAFSNKYSEETLDRIAKSADIVIASQGD
ncbi:MAG: hypothetical protein HXY24_15125 [Rubrivivax sp.]|nr:hypothetical protein [Rubrivivax sp.]